MKNFQSLLLSRKVNPITKIPLYCWIDTVKTQILIGGLHKELIKSIKSENIEITENYENFYISYTDLTKTLLKIKALHIDIVKKVKREIIKKHILNFNAIGENI